MRSPGMDVSADRRRHRRHPSAALEPAFAGFPRTHVAIFCLASSSLASKALSAMTLHAITVTILSCLCLFGLAFPTFPPSYCHRAALPCMHGFSGIASGPEAAFGRGTCVFKCSRLLQSAISHARHSLFVGSVLSLTSAYPARLSRARLDRPIPPGFPCKTMSTRFLVSICPSATKISSAQENKYSVFFHVNGFKQVIV
ncbi:hypothetical protein B0T22DRAFT_456167 [Podospora appendiculata]|uniref:Uncharacterized protein n=1 Tax=Podospora appendiculata TaxID=314037 RepID=A0AAE1CIY6_9PEZI|nr:hypothetical protein B0T22DRAFT_456167 [Podospora appendiculata]